MITADKDKACYGLIQNVSCFFRAVIRFFRGRVLSRRYKLWTR